VLKPPPFAYAAPSSIDEALSLLAEYGEDAKLLAGGQSLVPLLALRLARPSALIDLGGVSGLSHIRREDGYVAVGAMARERQAERSQLVRSAVPLLAEAMPLIGHIAIRNRGTIGGSTAHADPSAEIPAVAVTLDAQLVARSSSRGERTIAAVDFFRGFFTTVLEPDEALIELRFPAAGPRTGVAFAEAARRHGDFAMVGAAATLRLEDGLITWARLTLIGVASTPLRRHDAEDVLIGAAPVAATFQASAALAAESLEPHSDLHGTSAYRTHLARVLARRALETAARRAEEAA